MLEINNIEVVYMNVILVLRGITLKVPDGSIIALLGANGAGKTTTLKAISGMLETEEGKVTDGSIVWGGQRIENSAPEGIVEQGIVQVMEGRRLFEHLTTEENIKVGAGARRDGGSLKDDLERVYDYFPPLKSLRNTVSGYLSGGEQQMLVVGRAMMSHPRLMLLDEPSLGLSPILTEEMMEIIRRINQEEKAAILIVEQNAHSALELADYGYVMENGRIVLDGPAEKLRENEDVREFYLGLTEIGRKSYREVKHYKRRKRWLG